MSSSAYSSGNNTAAGGSSYYGLSPEQATREFDSLRREATRLERMLEDRVARYGQVSYCSWDFVIWRGGRDFAIWLGGILCVCVTCVLI
jgi:hypothetical protein